jgi:hypothetical protein
MHAAITDVDPFDLPEWLGTSDVVWQSEAGLGAAPLVRGVLAAGDEHTLACDLLAVDEAYPEPVVDETTRARVHLAWRHGQVVVGDLQGRSVLAVPGRRLDPDLVLEALTRLAKAVGATPERFAAQLRLSEVRRGLQGGG